MNSMTPNHRPSDDDDDDMAQEYDFTDGIRGKHAQAYQRGYTTLIHKADGTTEERTSHLPEGAVILDPDVRAYFPDAESVNTVLRELIKLIPPVKRTPKRAEVS